MVGTVEIPMNAAQLRQVAPAPTSGGPVADALQDAYSTGRSYALGMIYSNRALPSFLYPSVTGTPAEKAIIMQTLDSLPLRDISQASTVTMRNSLGGGGLLGVTRPAVMTIDIARDGTYLANGTPNPAMIRYTLEHELGHTQDYAGGIAHVLVGGHSRSGPWGQGPFVSDYAATQAPEDFAETHAWYHLGPDSPEIRAMYPKATSTSLQEINPEKYREMERLSQPNAFDAFFSQKAFRDTGRTMGNALAAVPFLRFGLAFLSQIAVLNLGVNGVSELFNGVSTSNGGVAVDGALDLAAGASLAFTYFNPLLGPAALVFLGGRQGLENARNRNASTGQAAAAMAGGALGGVVGGVGGPVGGTLAGYAIGGPVGGAIGLVVGGVLGLQVGSRLGADAGLWLAGKR